MVIPENRRNEEGKLKQITNDQLHVAKARTNEREDTDNPESICKNQSDSKKCKQAAPTQRDDAKSNAQYIDHQVVSESNENSCHRPRDIDLYIDRSGGDQH